MKTLLLRADAGVRIGTGHAMRCLALAQAWQSSYGSSVFIGRLERGALADRIEAAGIRYVPLDSVHPDPFDIASTLQLARDIRAAGVVIDGYHFDADYARQLRSSGYPALVIDDLAHLSRYEADLLLNQNLNAGHLKYRCNPDASLLLGSRYALLRSEFQARNGILRSTAAAAKRVLITLGGADPDNATLKVTRALLGLKDTELQVRIVVGAVNPHLGSIQSAVASAPEFRVLQHVSNMPGLMEWADVAIASAGSSCWELAFMGVPAVLVILADNQVGIASAMADAGIAETLGWHRQASESQVRNAVRRLLLDPDRRRSMSEAGRQAVDGRGASRVADAFHMKTLRQENGYMPDNAGGLN